MIMQLRARDLLRLKKARFAKVEVRAGRVWITEEGRAGDHVLRPGDRYRVQGNGLVLIGTEVDLAPGRAVELALTTYDEPGYAGASFVPGMKSLRSEPA